MQGFRVDETSGNTAVRLENISGHSQQGNRSLAIHFSNVSPENPARIATATFIPPDAISMPGYGFVASPTLYPGQTLKGRLEASEKNTGAVRCRPYIGIYNGDTNSVGVTRCSILCWCHLFSRCLQASTNPVSGRCLKES